MSSTEKNKDWRYRSVILTLKRWKQKGQFQKSKVILSYILSIKTPVSTNLLQRGKILFYMITKDVIKMEIGTQS